MQFNYADEPIATLCYSAYEPRLQQKGHAPGELPPKPAAANSGTLKASGTLWPTR